ncbi:ABC transporter permease [Paenibacillus sp. GCM10027626]|uniref:ABC transporter permease n=1 Tax=Paenibacillus sp. GCM10027626 TaxID=3273411 RepID=UPI0036458161
MTLFSIAGKNIRKNFTQYFLYFISMIFSIVIYFTFVSLKYDQTIQAAGEGSAKINSVFSAAAVVLIIFAAIFIWYSNAFFIRKRKKEVALYSLLGVRKKQIGRMLFYENFLMGTLALIVGILLGSLLSRFFVMILMRVMGYEEAIVSFTASTAAIVNTFIVFIIITLITSIQGYRLIYRFKLIELFHADQQHEKEPRSSLSIALLSLILIGFGYWLALQNLLHSQVWAALGFMTTPLVILAAVILGTYLLFNTLTVTLLKLSRRNKRSYWRGMNIIGTSQLLYRMKGNARTLTIIAVLSATTLTAVGTAYSFYYNNYSSVSQLNPNSMMFISPDNKTADQIHSMIQQSPEHKLEYGEALTLLEVDTITAGSEEQTYTILSNQDFNRMAELQGHNDRLSLQAGEAAALEPMYVKGLSPEYVGTEISIAGNEALGKLKFSALKQYNVLNQRSVFTTIVVSDDMFAKLKPHAHTKIAQAYAITRQTKAKQLTEEIKKLLPEEAGFTSFYDDYAQGMEASGLMIFMGGFLGLVFLAATGSIIYFKQLTEANADKARYHILYKIGVNRREIRATVAKQVLFIFALPLLAGLAHCTVALIALSRLIQTNLVVPVFICMGAYTCIYLVYYVLTVSAYYKIVTNTK